MRILGPLYSILRNSYLVVKKPQALKRGNNPLQWAFQRVAAEWKFESVKVDEAQFVAFLAGRSLEECKSFLDGATLMARVPVLYLITKMLKPKIVVETGVATGGGSTTSILLAMEENKEGNLYSIDLPSSQRLEDGNIYVLADKEVGYEVPPNLRHRWNLVLGDSRNELPRLLRKLGEIDIFIHDSLHTEKHMMWEYETAWPFLKPGGVLVSHDISIAFIQFAGKVGRTFTCCGGISTKYGGIVK